MCWWDQYSQAASAGFGTRVHWRWPGGGQWETLHKPQTIPKSTGTFFWLMKTRRYVPPRTVSNGPLGATMTLWNYSIYWYMTTCHVPVGLLSTHTSYVTQQQPFKYLFLTAQSQTEDDDHNTSIYSRKQKLLWKTKGSLVMACHNPPLKKAKKHRKMPLSILGPIPSLNSTFYA